MIKLHMLSSLTSLSGLDFPTSIYFSEILMFGKPLDKSGNHLGYCPSQTFQTCSFLKLSYANKDLDAIDLGNILYHKSVKYKNPSYCKDKSAPINSLVEIPKEHKTDLGLPRISFFVNVLSGFV
jgi:hypothetical protein